MMTEWKLHDRCWFWTKLKGQSHSFKEYVTVVKVDIADMNSVVFVRVRTDAGHNKIRPVERLHRIDEDTQ